LLKDTGRHFNPNIPRNPTLFRLFLFFGSLNFLCQKTLTIAVHGGALFVDTIPVGNSLLVGKKPSRKYNRVNYLKPQDK
jgi:hypothetical protein